MKDTKKLVVAALMAALTCAATMVIKIPTPTFGYIHPGDGLVLLCGIVLGPVGGALAAGIGSMLADVFSGYMSFALGTLIIKALTAAIAGLLFRRIRAIRNGSTGSSYAGIITGGVAGELFMAAGYLFYETLLAVISGSALAAAFTASAAGVIFNIVQGVVGIVLAILLFPVLYQIPNVRAWVTRK